MEMEVNHAPSTGKTGKVKMSFFFSGPIDCIDVTFGMVNKGGKSM